MRKAPLNDLPDPLFLVISLNSLLSHNAAETSPWRSLLDSHLDKPWPEALEQIWGEQWKAQDLKEAIATSPIQGKLHTPLVQDDAWQQICAQWYTDSDSEKTYLTLTTEFTPMQSSTAPIETGDAFSLRPLMLRLRQAESRLETYLHHFPGVMFSQRPDGSFAFVSPKLQEWIGSSAQRLTRSANGLAELIAPEDRESALNTIRNNSPKGTPYSLQYRLVHPETRLPIYVYDIRLPIVLNNQTHLQDEGIWIDVTRQALAENRISSSLWKENLAKITSGLVHDFSNSMAGIFSLSELYHSEMEPEHPRHEGMGQIKSHAMRAQRLVRRIVEMNRDVAGDTNYHNLEVLIRDHEDIIKIILPKSAQLDLRFPDEEMLVYLDEVAFRQALTHFVTNAREVLANGGTFGIHIARVEGGFEMHIWDDGPGIPEAIKQNIFTPFGTSKEDSDASGYGLYSAHTFVENAGGLLRLGSNQYPGAHFILFLPNADTVRENKDAVSTEYDIQARSPEALDQTTPSPLEMAQSTLLFIGECVHTKTNIHNICTAENWRFEAFEDSFAAAKSIDEKSLQPGVIIFALDSKHPLKASDLEPLSQWSDTAMICLFLMPNSPKPVSEFAELFDLVLDTSLGAEGLLTRLTPWMG